MRVIVSLRGYVEFPILYEVDLSRGEITRKVEFKISNIDHVPKDKKGFSGLASYGKQVVAATWDRICFIDMDREEIIKEVTHKNFSDLHGISVDKDNDIWVTSTNIDRVYKVSNNEVNDFWGPKKGLDKQILFFLWRNVDFRVITKNQSPFHEYHVNSVNTIDNLMVVSYLGKERKDTRLNRLLYKTQLKKRYEFEGGAIVLNRETKRLRKKYSFEGIHDTYLLDGNTVVSTEYFGNTIILMNLKDFTVERVKLEVDPKIDAGYLARGIFFDGEHYWVGRTPDRGWLMKNPISQIQKFSERGEKIGDPIILDGYYGVFSILAYPE